MYLSKLLLNYFAGWFLFFLLFLLAWATTWHHMRSALISAWALFRAWHARTHLSVERSLWCLWLPEYHHQKLQTSHLFHLPHCCCYLFCHYYSLNYSLYHFLVLARIFENFAKLSNILGFRKWLSQPMRSVIFQMLFKFLNVSIIVPWVEVSKTYLQ